MGKKIKISEAQFKNILNTLTENSNINDVLKNLTSNTSIKLVDDNDKEIVLKIVNQNNDDFKAVDSGNTEYLFNKKSYNDTTKEFNFKVFNTTTNTFIDKMVKIKDIEKLIDDEEEKDDNSELFTKYYRDVVNNTELQKAFYTAPSLWNYFTAALKNEKARGSGLYPAYKLINNFFSKSSNNKLPGFTNKENLSALFIVPNRIKIYYQYKNGERDFFVMEAGENKAVVRPYEPGFGDSKVLVRRNYGFKIVVKKPTGENDDQYYCDIYVEKKGVKPDTYKEQNVKLTFLKSKGYEPKIKTKNK